MQTRVEVRLKSVQCLLCNVLFEFSSPLPLVCFSLLYRLSRFVSAEIVAQKGFEPSQRALSTKNARLNGIFMKLERFLPKMLVLNWY